MNARETPFLAWGDFHACSRFARSTIPEEKWGTTRSLGIKTMGRYKSHNRLLAVNEQNHVLHKPVPGSLVTLISVFCFFGGIHLQQIPMAFPLETFKRPGVNTAEVKFSTVLAKNVTSVLGFKVLNGQTSEFSYRYHRSV